MQRQYTATLRPSRQGRRSWLMAACSAALLAAVAVGAWQTVARREGATSTTVAQTTAGRVPSAATRRAAAPSESMTVYLVGSAEDAARLTDALVTGDQILGQLGRPPFNAQVVVAASAEEGAATVRAYADADAIRAGMGLPPIALIDLRSQ